MRRELQRAMAAAVAALALGGTAHANEREGAHLAFADCGSMWLEHAAARARVDVFAGLLSRRDTAVRYDLPPEYASTTGPLPQVAVYECKPAGESAGAARLDPVNAVLARAEAGAPQVTWTLSGQTLPLAQRRYHVYLADAGAPTLKGRAVAGAPVRLPGENLLPNGGFELADSRDPGAPEGWFVTGMVEDRGVTTTSARASRAARSGEGGVLLAVEAAGRAGSGPGAQASLAEPIRVRPGVRYVLDAWVRVDAATGVGVNLSAPFLGPGGEPLSQRIHIATAPGETTAGWVQLRGWAVAPPDAAFLRLSVGSLDSVGVAMVDDVSLYADPVGIGPSPRVVPLPLEDRAVPRVPLRLPAGGEAWMFDFGPEDSPLAGGFIPVSPTARFGPDALYGFCNDAPVRAAVGPRPDALAQDHVDFSESSFCLRMPDGPVVVWLLLGDLTTPGPAPWTSPQFYRTAVAVQAGTEARRLDNPLLDFGSLHLEPEDDAVAQLKEGAWAPHARYVEPRFTSSVFASTVEGGVLKVHCQPTGACPVAAFAAFRGGSLERVQEEVAYLQALRRWSFTVAWAQPHLPATHTAAFSPDPEQERLGFVAFATDTDSDVYPHTTPTAEQVQALAQGITLRMPQGEVASASLGVFPLVFRRALTVELEPPTDRLGEGLGDDDLQALQVRYRMARLAESERDPRYALRPQELTAAKNLAVRPGLTRQLWITAKGRAKPGRYEGALRLDAGPDRVLRVPLVVEVLPFALAPAPTRVRQGVLGGAYAPGGDPTRTFADQRAHGMELLDLSAAPSAQRQGGQVSVDLTRMSAELAAAKRAGFEASALITRQVGELAFSLTGEPLVDPAYDGPPERRGKRSFSSAFDAAYLELVGATSRHARQAGWPPLVHLVAEGAADAGELGLAYERHLLERCRQAGPEAVCAASISGPRSLEHLDVMNAVLVQPGVGLSADTLDRLRQSPKGQPRRSVWLHRLGAGRYARGLYAWAAGVEAVVDGPYAEIDHAGDPFDPWDSDETKLPYVRPSSRGLVPLVRWERARLGANDARLLAHLEGQLERAQQRGHASADAVKKAALFLRELKKRIDLEVTPDHRTWDGRLTAPRFPRGPDLDLIHGALLDLAGGLHDLLGP